MSRRAQESRATRRFPPNRQAASARQSRGGRRYPCPTAHQPQKARLAASWHSLHDRSCEQSRALCAHSRPNQPLLHLHACAPGAATALAGGPPDVGAAARQLPWPEHSGVPGQVAWPAAAAGAAADTFRATASPVALTGKASIGRRAKASKDSTVFVGPAGGTSPAVAAIVVLCDPTLFVGRSGGAAAVTAAADEADKSQSVSHKRTAVAIVAACLGRSRALGARSGRPVAFVWGSSPPSRSMYSAWCLF
eukprot:scaffold31270_cov112-Isochrysis_galbana.AAC.1